MNGNKLPPLKLKQMVLNSVAEKKQIQNKQKTKKDLLDYNDTIFQLNKKYQKQLPEKKEKPFRLSLNEIAKKLLDKEQLIDFNNKFPHLSASRPSTASCQLMAKSLSSI